MNLKKNIPLLLIIFRLVLAPIILATAYFFKDSGRIAIVIMMYLGLISDIFDGIIARHLNVTTETLRRLDSQIDMVFWIALVISSWMLNPDLFASASFPIILIFCMEAMSYTISLVKFGKEYCTHAYITKFWGITLLIAFTSLVGFGHAGIPFVVAIVFGLLSNIDVILISFLLPVWTHDVPSSYHAWLIRKGRTFKKYKLFN